MPAKPALNDASARLLQEPGERLPDKDTTLSPEEVFSLYERHRRHSDPARITGKEASLLKRLANTVGKGVVLV